jgi:hypothetical protein
MSHFFTLGTRRPTKLDRQCTTEPNYHYEQLSVLYHYRLVHNIRYNIHRYNIACAARSSVATILSRSSQFIEKIIFFVAVLVSNVAAVVLID